MSTFPGLCAGLCGLWWTTVTDCGQLDPNNCLTARPQLGLWVTGQTERETDS